MSKKSLLTFALILLSCSIASAYTIIIDIEATIDTVIDNGNYLEGLISPGNIITGSYIFESTTPDTNPLSNGGDYWHSLSPAGFFLSAGGFDFQTDPADVDFLVEIADGASGLDNYLVRSYNNLNLSNGINVEEIVWQLDDNTTTALSSAALPLTAPILSQWSGNNLNINGERWGYTINAHVTSATAHTPEPATVLLLSLGALCIRNRSGSAKRKKTRSTEGN